MLRKITIGIILLAVLLLGTALYTDFFGGHIFSFREAENLGKEKLITAEIGVTKIQIEIADTDSEKAAGLSGRKSLANNKGMLFDFTSSQNKRPLFWMKGMLFNIDIIWIKDNKIIGITPNIKTENPNLPEYELSTYPPPADIDYALEVNAGFADNHNIQIGENFKLIK